MYQRSCGGKIWVPLEAKAQLLGGSYTPKFSQMISWKYAHLAAGAVCEDIELNHGRKMGTKLVQSIGEAVGDFENNLHRMKYAQYQKEGCPIGSGVTEAACKVVVKQRLNQSGMKWNLPAVEKILLLRGIICTTGRWTQFWKQYDKIAA